MSDPRGATPTQKEIATREREEQERAEQEGKERNRLPDDASVDVEVEKKESSSDKILDRIDRELIGSNPVKQRVREIADLLVVDRLRNQFGIDSARPTRHMCFTGSPGTGKTTVAWRMAELLKDGLPGHGPPGERDPLRPGGPYIEAAEADKAEVE